MYYVSLQTNIYAFQISQLHINVTLNPQAIINWNMQCVSEIWLSFEPYSLYSACCVTHVLLLVAELYW